MELRQGTTSGRFEGVGRVGDGGGMPVLRDSNCVCGCRVYAGLLSRAEDISTGVTLCTRELLYIISPHSWDKVNFYVARGKRSYYETLSQSFIAPT